MGGRSVTTLLRHAIFSHAGQARSVDLGTIFAFSRPSDDPDHRPRSLLSLSDFIVLPAESLLEVRERLPASASRKPPLLFVHGGYCDAWCWEPYFLPWFASRGYPSYALSLRGHGASGGGRMLFVAGLDDYEADVEHVAGELDAPPVLIGHSMGAAIVERIVAKRPVRGAALLAPVPPAGLLPMAARLAAESATDEIGASVASDTATNSSAANPAGNVRM